ncbi:hypothetical protein MASR2M64_14350 [Candidatus Cloacimonadota bacterium]|nr:hypothetical protein [Candidatus Cloacimonadota bacterium]
MKVELKYNLRGYSGKLGNMVYCSYYNYRLCHSRIFTYPKLSENHLRMRDISHNLNELYLQASEAYRSDLQLYSRRNAMENQARSVALRKQMPGAKALFVQCMWAWAKANPEALDLKTITLTEMLALESPVCRVCTSVEAGYLKKVSRWEELTQLIA